MPHRFTTPPRRGRTPSKPGTIAGQVQSLTRGLNLLDALAKADGGITLTDVAQRVDLPPSTAHRLLSTLEKMGYARADRTLTDEAILGSRYRIDIAGELYAVTPHLKLG